MAETSESSEAMKVFENCNTMKSNFRISMIYEQAEKDKISTIEMVRARVGSRLSKLVTNEPLKTCDICYHDFPISYFHQLPCDHIFCKECMLDFLKQDLKEKERKYCP